MRFIMNDLLQNQILGPQDREMILEAFDLGHPSIITDQSQADRARAREENRLMSSGQVVQPSMYENHEVHRRTHDAFRKSAEFKELEENTRKWFEIHDRMHKKLAAIIAVEPTVLMQEAQATVMAQATGQDNTDAGMPMGGGPGQPPSGGGPSQQNAGQPASAPTQAGSAAPPPAPGMDMPQMA